MEHVKACLLRRWIRLVEVVHQCIRNIRVLYLALHLYPLVELLTAEVDEAPKSVATPGIAIMKS